MSSPIKPPGSGPPPGPGGPEGPSGPQGPGGADAPFRESLEQASESHGTPGPQQTNAIEGLGRIAEDLRAGRIDSEQAVQRLVERTIERAGALPPAARAELEAHLRRVLSEDPALSALTKDLDRGS